MKTIIINSQALPGNNVPQDVLDMLSESLQVDLPVDVKQSMEKLDQCRDCDLCIGTGYNSLWATYLSQNNNIPCILINPKIDASDYLSRQVGKENSNISVSQVVDYVRLEHMIMELKPHAYTSVIYTEQPTPSTKDYFSDTYTFTDTLTAHEYLAQMIGNLTAKYSDAIITA